MVILLLKQGCSGVGFACQRINRAIKSMLELLMAHCYLVPWLLVAMSCTTIFKFSIV